MITVEHIKFPRMVFSKWSRKGYAVFASLTKVVEIAPLSNDVFKIEEATLSIVNKFMADFTLVVNDNITTQQHYQQHIIVNKRLKVKTLFNTLIEETRISPWYNALN